MKQPTTSRQKERRNARWLRRLVRQHGNKHKITANTFSVRSQAPLRMQPLSNPILHSASLQRFACRLTYDEARRLLAEDRVRPKRRLPVSTRLWAKCCQYSICRKLALHLRQNVFRLAVRWPTLQTHLPSIQRLAREAALVYRAKVESGEVLSLSDSASLVCQLEAYRDEWSKIVVLSNADIRNGDRGDASCK